MLNRPLLMLQAGSKFACDVTTAPNRRHLLSELEESVPQLFACFWSSDNKLGLKRQEGNLADLKIKEKISIKIKHCLWRPNPTFEVAQWTWHW